MQHKADFCPAIRDSMAAINCATLNKQREAVSVCATKQAVPQEKGENRTKLSSQNLLRIRAVWKPVLGVLFYNNVLF